MGHYSTLCCSIILNEHIKNRAINGDQFIIIPNKHNSSSICVKKKGSPLRNITNRQVKPKQLPRIEFTTSSTAACINLYLNKLLKYVNPNFRHILLIN